MTTHTFDSPADLANALSETVANVLRQAIDARGGAVLAVSGGSTPGALFDALAREKLDWTKVVVTLVDERFVAPTSDRSNERLVRDRLLIHEARLARFMPLYSDTTPEVAAKAADADVALLGTPFDVVVLGMGSDGHTASFFPDAENLPELIDLRQKRHVLPVETKAGGEPRLTLTLPVIVSARLLILHIEGDAKRSTLDRALGGEHLPIRAVIDAAPHIEIYWTP